MFFKMLIVIPWVLVVSAIILLIFLRFCLVFGRPGGQACPDKVSPGQPQPDNQSHNLPVARKPVARPGRPASSEAGGRAATSQLPAARPAAIGDRVVSTSLSCLALQLCESETDVAHMMITLPICT